MTDRTIAFVDLAGFTALADAHGPTAAADLIDRFTDLAVAAAHPGVDLVKSIGDAVMLAALDRDSGLASVVDLLERCLAEPNFPLARAGVHHGDVEARGGDYFGTTVNVAARLAGIAGNLQIVFSDAVRAAAREAGFAFTPLGAVPLKNLVQPVTAYAIDLKPAASVTDPVCRMRVEPAHAVGMLRHGDQEYFFCSLECAARFAADPATYTSTW